MLLLLLLWAQAYMRIGHHLLAGQGDEAVRARVADALSALMSANGLVQVVPYPPCVCASHAQHSRPSTSVRASVRRTHTFLLLLLRSHLTVWVEERVVQSTDRMNLRRFRKNLHSFLGAVRGLVRTK
jgi:hypothetical protein